ncbi:MAG: DoxX family protein [Sphingobacteriia bacterium]|nr:MAG: DoxX family protein [Sphingobacteriia bacterium]
MLTQNQTRLAWVLRLIAAIIMLQTLYFKFTGAEESIYIFTTLGIEPYGRIGSGIGELIASILILIPSTTAIGALLAVGIMSGAIMSHLTKLGIVIQNDGGQLFVYALLVFISSAILVILHKDQLINIIQKIKNK